MAESTIPSEKSPVDIMAIAPRNGEVDAEAAHRYVIDPVAEAKLVRKQDIRVLPLLGLMYFLTFLYVTDRSTHLPAWFISGAGSLCDRSNLGNARIAGLEADLGLGTYGFNIGACVFYAVYLFADIPASLCVKKFGFIVLPFSCISFGILTLCTAFVQNQGGFYVLRMLLGLTEAFQFPGLSYVVSRYYRRHEVTTRISFFMLSAAGLSGAFGALLASGLLSVGSIGSVTSWRNIFLVEGIITVGIGILMLYFFPADPSKTRIFTEEERALAMARIFHDQPDIREHKEKITWPLVKRGIFNVNVVIGCWIFICNNITVAGLSIFTPTILRLNYPGRSIIDIQLLSVPPPLVGTVISLSIAYLTMKTGKHGIAIACAAAANVLGYSIWLATTDVQARYAAVFINTAAGYTFGPLVISWTLSNASPDTIRNVSSATISAIGNIGSIIATWSYISTDAGTGFKIGNSLNTASAATVIVATLSLLAYQMWENKRRANGDRDYLLEKSAEEVATLGHLHPQFRYIY